MRCYAAIISVYPHLAASGMYILLAPQEPPEIITTEGKCCKIVVRSTSNLTSTARQARYSYGRSLYKDLQGPHCQHPPTKNGLTFRSSAVPFLLRCTSTAASRWCPVHACLRTRLRAVTKSETPRHLCGLASRITLTNPPL